MSAPVDVLAVRWVAEPAVATNGMHEIRAGAVNVRERPLIGYAATYADAREIADAHNRGTAVAELIEADRALDAIDAELPCKPENMPDPLAYLARREAALQRRAAALARVHPMTREQQAEQAGVRG